MWLSHSPHVPSRLWLCASLVALLCGLSARQASAAPGSLCAGNAACPGTSTLAVYNPTHYAVPVGDTANVAIVGATDLLGTETCGGNPGVQVTFKHSLLGNVTTCGTLSGCPGASCTVSFSFTAPESGCQTGIVAYKTNGNNANNDIIDDGAKNGSASAVGGLAFVSSADDPAAISCAGVATTIHDADHNPVTTVEPGTTVHDFISVAGPIDAPTPTGSVTLKWFTTGDCSGTASATSGPLPLVGGQVDATGFAQTPGLAGSYSFQASYSGDGTYDAAVGPCEPLEVRQDVVLGKLRVCKYEDVDADGQRGDDESPLSGWEFTLYDDQGEQVGEPQETGDDGCTEFTDLPPGTYTAKETLQPGWFNTDPGLDGAPCMSDTCANPSKEGTVVEDQTVELQFGNVEACTIQVCKYEDANANGQRDDDEAFLSGWTIGLDDTGSATTDDSGCVSFLVVPVGNHTLSEDLQAGPPPWFNTDPGLDGAPCLPADCPKPQKEQACATPGGSTTVEFGNLQSAEKHGQKFYDANVDGTNNDGQVVEGIKIQLTGTAVDGSSVMLMTQTDVNGDYEFTGLLPGTYKVQETLPNASWLNTTPKSIDFTLLAGEVETDNDFGNVCIGAGGGLTLGFWSNKNGENTIKNGPGSTAGALTFLSGLNLRNANGTAFDPTTYTAFRTWILGASATNMAYMLSAQLAAMELNVRQGLVVGTKFLSVGAAPAGCTVPGLSGGFITVNDLMSAANSTSNHSLMTDSVTTMSGAARSCQEFMKTALDRGNNNLNFVQTRPCPF